VVDDMKDKMVFLITTGLENLEKAITSFKMVSAAVANDMKTTVILQLEGVLLALKGITKKIKEHDQPSLGELIEDLLSQNVPIYVCSGCAERRNLKQEDMLNGVKFVSGGTIMDEAFGATVITY
jgi:predicted peroxiredoxin